MIEEHPAIRPPLLSAVGLSRASLYYQPKQPEKDWALKQEIEAVLREHPAYGHKRIALALKRNKKPVLRVMKIFGIKPYRRRVKKWRKQKVKSGIYPNLLLTTTPLSMHHIWVADFTHLVWKNKVVYVATVMDVFTRRIVGLSVLTTHHAVLVVQALLNALFHNPPPLIFHSDNGSEYDAAVTREILNDFRILISRSAPGARGRTDTRSPSTTSSSWISVIRTDSRHWENSSRKSIARFTHTTRRGYIRRSGSRLWNLRKFAAVVL